jgi:hypothetical protein
MKKIFFIGVFIFVCMFLSNDLNAQKSFEGIITYRHLIDIKDTTLKAKEMDLTLQFGIASTLHISSKGNYKWFFDTSTLTSQMYLYENNMLYDQFLKNDTLYFTEASKVNEHVLEESIKPSKTKILGKNCNLLLLKTQSRKTGNITGKAYYYTSDYRVDARAFSKFKMNSIDKVFKVTQAVPLQIILIFKGYRIIYEATKIEEKKVDLKLFELKGKKTKQMKA